MRLPITRDLGCDCFASLLPSLLLVLCNWITSSLSISLIFYPPLSVSVSGFVSLAVSSERALCFLKYTCISQGERRKNHSKAFFCGLFPDCLDWLVLVLVRA